MHLLQLDIQTREYISLCVHPTHNDAAMAALA